MSHRNSLHHDPKRASHPGGGDMNGSLPVFHLPVHSATHRSMNNNNNNNNNNNTNPRRPSSCSSPYNNSASLVVGVNEDSVMSMGMVDDGARGGNVILPYEQLPAPRQPIYRVVITGGPCSGKSTCATYFKKELEAMGYTVFCLPEVATMIMLAGCRLWLTPEEAAAEQTMMKEREQMEEMKAGYCRSALRRCSVESTDSRDGLRSPPNSPNYGENFQEEDLRGGHRHPQANPQPKGTEPAAAAEERSDVKELLQRRVLQNMLVHEDTFFEIGRALNKPVVILIDRGTLDGSAYCTKQDWGRIVKSTNYNEEELVEARYDAVIHFVTAAEGAEKFYSLDNNDTRHETPQEAIVQDGMTRRAWRSFPQVMVIDNSTAFEPKLRRALEQMKRIMPQAALPRLPFMSGPTGDRSGQHHRGFGPLTMAALSRPNGLLSGLSAAQQEEIRRAHRHTGSIFFASPMGLTPVESGVQRFIRAASVNWEELEKGTSGSTPWVTKKTVNHYFVNPENEGCETREAELLVRVEGTVGMLGRPVFLRRAKFRYEHTPSIMKLNPLSETMIPQATAFESTCRITEEQFTHRIRHSTPALPLVEKEVFRFMHGLVHLTVVRYVEAEWNHEAGASGADTAREPVCCVVGPATLTPGQLPNWIKVTPEAYADSWISRELII